MKKPLLVLLIFFLIIISGYSNDSDLFFYVKNYNVKQGHCIAIFALSKTGISQCFGEFNGKYIRFFNIYKNKIFRSIVGIDVEHNPGKNFIRVNVKKPDGKNTKEYRNKYRISRF